MADEDDAALEECLRRIRDDAGDQFEDLADSMKRFSNSRMKAMCSIATLKDSASKRQEIIGHIEELSILFFQLGLKYNAAQNAQRLEEKLSAIEDKIVSGSAQPQATFAEAVRSDRIHRVQAPSGKTVKPAPKKSILITPLDTSEHMRTSEDTKKVLLSKIKPAELGIKPDRIMKRGINGIRIESREIDELKIDREALRKAGLQATLMGKFKPRMAVFGVPSDLEAPDLKKELVAELGENTFNPDSIIIKSKFGPRNKHFNHWVIEVDHEIRKELLNRERVYIQWSSCIVKDHIRVVRCFKCQKYGHLQKDCKGVPTCGHCAEAHDTKDCKSLDLPPKCVNCCNAGIRDSAHEAKAQKCPVYTRKVNDIITNTDYGQ